MVLVDSVFDTIKFLGRPNLVFAILILLINGALAYFFFIYCFRNPDGYPDSTDCHATYGSKYGFDHSGSGDSKVSREFHIWLLFGFIINSISILYSILAICYVVSKSKILQILTNTVGIIMFIGTVFLITAGVVTRFDFVGRVCSGDFY